MTAHRAPRRSPLAPRRSARSWLSTLLAPRETRRPTPRLRILLDPGYTAAPVRRGRHWAPGAAS